MTWVGTGIIDRFGWFYVFCMNILVIAVVIIGLSKVGKIRLGPDHSKPEFSTLSWLAMLFSAGMGIGMLFYGVAEPLMHFFTPGPPFPSAESSAAARNAMATTFFHWGLHPWACYAAVGLILGYFAYRKKKPLTFRSALYPIFGKKMDGIYGHIVDIIAIVATLFGVATSLGLGSLQINSGLNTLFDVPEDVVSQMLIIGLITLCATLSVVSGVDSGIKKLSQGNLLLALILITLVFLLGPTQFLFDAFIENLGSYIQTLPTKSFWTGAYSKAQKQWLGDWTLFYWAWWISWSPFVGMFLARISKGRTIREFVFGVLLIPVGFTLVWFTILGNSAIWFEINDVTNLHALVNTNLPQTFYAFLDAFPFGMVLKLIATVSITLFFITSSDSASLVIDIISSNGITNPHKWLVIFWASMEGLVAAVLLLGGGLKALQTAAISVGIGFSAVALLGTYGLFKALGQEKI